MINPWSINPTWQSFSSLVREAETVMEARTALERFHHLTAALYFAVAALEAFLNAKGRAHLAASHTEEEIRKALRVGTLPGEKKGRGFLEKLWEWPEAFTGTAISVQPKTQDKIELFNDIRGNLTHAKTSGHDVYRALGSIDPLVVVEAAAEYIAQCHLAEGSRFPYWLWGWNYLNPKPDTYAIELLGVQEFVTSMMNIGYRVTAGNLADSAGWQQHYMSDYAGYGQVAQVLRSLSYCEPKDNRFPFRPTLCRRWWDQVHQNSCGHVSQDAMDRAM
jgi:hypothetical protein